MKIQICCSDLSQILIKRRHAPIVRTWSKPEELRWDRCVIFDSCNQHNDVELFEALSFLIWLRI